MSEVDSTDSRNVATQQEDKEESSELNLSDSEPVEDEECYHNPEPAPELASLINADNVGNTVFSKHWIFTTLMNLIKVVERGDEQGQGESVVDLDEALQDDLCKLWDMSMNQEVVKFLMEYKTVDMLMAVIAKPSAPRATEISVGILGNMACVSGVCEEIGSNKLLIDLALHLLEVPDPPTLVETTRLIRVFVSNVESSSVWFEALKENTEVVTTNIHFILQSSTNEDLLKSTAELVYKVLEMDEYLCSHWSSPDLVLAIMEALKQTGSHKSQVLETFLQLLQLISTTENGVQALVSYAGEVCVLMVGYLVHISSDDIVCLEGREGVVVSALSVLTAVLPSWDSYKHLLFSDFQLLRCSLKILDVVCRKRQRQGLPQRCEGEGRERSYSMTISFNGDPGGDKLEKVQQNSCDKEDKKRTSSLELFTEETDGKDETTDSKDRKAEGDTHLSEGNTDIPGEVHGDHSGEARKEIVTSNEADKNCETREAEELKEQDREGKEEEKDVDEEEEKYIAAISETLSEVLQDILCQIIKTLSELSGSGFDAEESEKESLNDENRADGASQNSKVPQSLTYLDSMCDRNRLVALIRTVSEASTTTDSQDLVSALRDMANRYSLKRLTRIIDETKTHS